MAAGYPTREVVRRLDGLNDRTLYSDRVVDEAIAWVVAAVERVCRVSFVPVSRTVTLDGSTSDLLFLPTAHARAAVFTIDGTVVPSEQIRVRPGGLVYRRAGSASLSWWGTSGEVEVTYTEQAFDEVPDDLYGAMLVAIRARLLSDRTQIPDRAVSITNEFGNVQLSTAGINRPFGIPDVDAVVLGWAERLAAPRIA